MEVEGDDRLQHCINHHPRWYICKKCNGVFKTQSAYIRHVNSKHIKKAHLCQWCFRGYCRYDVAKKHMIKCRARPCYINKY